ncbi:hypothetical protein ACFX2J_029426 [Malus domestica]
MRSIYRSFVDCHFNKIVFPLSWEDKNVNVLVKRHNEKAFQDLKRYLASPPLLSKPEAAEELYIYLAVSDKAVSSALMRKKLGAQLLVYTSKALFDAKTRYSMIEKLILALIVATQKMRPYFQAHTVVAMTQYPLQSILHSLDAS